LTSNNDNKPLKPGAPKGGRVHWFTLVLPRLIKRHYRFEIDHDCERGRHNYHLRFDSVDRWDEYIIMRTSEKCYRVMYFDLPTQAFDYRTFGKAEQIVEYIMLRLENKLNRERLYEESRKPPPRA
jgi:hypothetical protein